MPTIPKARPRSAKEIEQAAEAVLLRFQPETLKCPMSSDVEAFFEFNLQEETGIEPVYKKLPANLDGYTDCVNMTCNVAQRLADHDGNLTKERRLRSTIAHEIGHCYLHVEDARNNSAYQQLFNNNGNFPAELFESDTLRTYENPEWQAWRFASAMLMPEVCFRRAVERKWTIRKIQNGFGVNPSFVDVRIKQLKIPNCLRRG